MEKWIAVHYTKTLTQNFENLIFYVYIEKKAIILGIQISSVTQLCPTETPWTAARQASPSITNSQSLLKLMSIESVMPSNQLIFCHPLHLLPPIIPSIRVFSHTVEILGINKILLSEHKIINMPIITSLNAVHLFLSLAIYKAHLLFNGEPFFKRVRIFSGYTNYSVKTSDSENKSILSFWAG